MNNEEISKIITNIKLKTSFSGGDELWGQALSVIKHLQAENATLRERLDKAVGFGDIREAEHRAARAEKALLTACIKMVKDEKSDVNIELLVGVIYRKYLKQAESELAEEGKDE